MNQTRYDELLEQVKIFHAARPEIFHLFDKFTYQLIARGFKNYSVNAIFERIRWETDQADTEGRASFKLNNNHRSFYARRWMNKHPEHRGFFRLREQVSKSGPATHLPPLRPADFPYVAQL